MMKRLLPALWLIGSVTAMTYAVIPHRFHGSLCTISHDAKTVADVITVKGRVLDYSSGESLPGVTIRIQGSNEGTTTDSQGRFCVKVRRRGLTLIFSFIGYETRSLSIDRNTENQIIRLRASAESLPEVVVTGYAPLKKEYFTGNTTRVEQADLLKAHPENMISALQTFDPSFRIIEHIEAGSNPNHLPQFMIRGQTGVGVTELDKNNDNVITKELLVGRSNLPIFILDGFEVDVVKVYDLDVNAVHSITILKDAAATALYGSRAANGVVVIEQKAPVAGKFHVQYRGNLTTSFPDLSSYSLMSASEKLEAERLSGLYDSNTPEIDPYTDGYYQRYNNILAGVDTYWPAQGLRTGVGQRHSLSVSGGEEEIRWSADMGFHSNPGVMRHSTREVLNATFTLDYRLGGLRLQNQIGYNEGHNESLPFTSFSDYVNILPYMRLYGTDGRYVRRLERFSGLVSQAVNPLYEAMMYQSYDKGNYREWSDHFSLNWKINDAWRVMARALFTRRTAFSALFKDPASAAFSRVVASEKGSKLENYNTRQIVDGGLSVVYDQSFGRHRLTSNLSGDLRETKGQIRRYSYRGFPSGGLSSANYAVRMDGRPIYADNTTRLLSTLLTANYSYHDVYIMDLTGRMDGSSEFGADRRWSAFGAVGVGANLQKIPALSRIESLSLLRLRGSYGITGKTNFSLYAARNMYDLEREDSYPTGYGVYLYRMGNPDLKWERKFGLDLGIEVGLWDERLYMKLSGYDERTVDLITDYTIPSSTGFTSYKENMGKVKNVGMELQFRGDIVRVKEILVRIHANMSHNRNTILEVSQAMRDYNKRVEEQFVKYNPNESNRSEFSKSYLKYYDGASLTSIYGMKSLGISPSNGREIFVNRRGEVTDQWSADEWTVIGDTAPLLQGSFGTTFSYRGLSIFASFLYTMGGDAYNATLVNRVENADLKYKNVDRRVLEQRWKKPGDRTTLKDIRSWNVTTGATSRFVQKDNTLRFSSLSLTYRFPEKFCRPLKMSRVQVGLSVNDVLYLSTIRRERGLDYPYAHSATFTFNTSF